MQNFEQQFLGLIIQEYETSVMKNKDSKSYKLMMYKSVHDLKSITSVTKKTTNSFPGSKYNFDKDPSSAKSRTKKKVSKKNLKGVGLDHLSDDKFEDYLEKCFGCDLRVSFDFQLLPPDFMINSFLDMLNEMNFILDQVSISLDSKKKIEQLCSVAGLFNGVPCPQDLITIILSLKILLGRYSDIGISLKIDWLTLLGPIIQGLTQLLGSLVSLIFDTVIGPIDCTGATMLAGLDILRIESPEKFSTSSTKPKATTLKDKEQNNESFLQTSVSGISSLSSGEVEASASINLDSLPMITTGKLPSMKMTDMMSSLDGNNFFDMSMPEQLVAAVGEARNFLNDFKMKILATVNNLNGLVKGGKLFELKNLAVAIFIADLISFLIQLVNTDFKTLCSDPSKSPILEEFIKDITGAESVSISSSGTETRATIYEIDGIEKNITLSSCSLSSNSVNINEIKNILAEIERLSNGK